MKTIKFLSTMRSDAVLGNLSTIERLALVESLRECSTCIAFKVFSCDLLEVMFACSQAACGLGAAAPVLFRVDRGALWSGGSARRWRYIFARERGRNVKMALLACGLEPERLEVISYGNRRPLVWAFGNPSGRKGRRFGEPSRRALRALARRRGCPHAAAPTSTRRLIHSRHRPRRPGIVDDEDPDPEEEPYP